jgi:hypothetical protein
VSTPQLYRGCSAGGLSAGFSADCLGRDSGFGSVGRNIREIKASTSDRLGGHEARGASGAAAGGVAGPAVGVFSGGVAMAAAGIFSNGRVAPAAAVLVSLSLGGAAPVVCPGAGASTLPRMIGKPSLPLPIITTFEFEDCES